MNTNIEEIWKDIIGYEGLYQVSNTGNVRSLWFSNENRKPRKLKQYISTNGYYQVALYKKDGNKGKSNLVHIFIAKSFLEKPNSYEEFEVNHIDGNKLNNNLSNLEWITRLENIRHSIKLGLKIPGESLRKPIICYKENVAIAEFISINQASRLLKVDETSIGRALAKFTYSCLGFNWKFKNTQDNENYNSYRRYTQKQQSD